MVSHLKKARDRWYSTETILGADDLALLANISTQAKSLLHNLEQAAKCIASYMNSDKTELMCFKQYGTISTLNGKALNLMNQFTYLGSNISSTESYVSILIEKKWNVINKL